MSSRSSVQKTFREELYNVFFSFTAVNGVSTPQTLNTADGRCRGITSVTGNGTGQYTIVLDEALGPIKNFVGRICETSLQGALTNANFLTLVSANAATRTIVLQGRFFSGSPGGITAGAICNGTITYSTSPVVY